jgi:dienelactone hydrolase
VKARILAALAICFFAFTTGADVRAQSTAPSAVPAIKRQITMIPVLIHPPKITRLEAEFYRPTGIGPFPLVLFSHGTPRDAADMRKMSPDYLTAGTWFASHGYIVVIPMRRGYGRSEDSQGDTYGSCKDPDYFHAGEEAARDILAALDYLRGQPDIDASRILLAGHSAGGWGSLAALSHSPANVLGAIVFAPARGSRQDDDTCAPDYLVREAGRFGGKASVPVLWFYSTNDHYMVPGLSRRMFDTFSHNHPQDDVFVQLGPYGDDGHQFIHHEDALRMWTPAAEAFLARLGLPH